MQALLRCQIPRSLAGWPPRLPTSAFTRALHATASTSALGVVEQLHDEVAIAQPAGSGRRFWECVEFRPGGTALETWKTPEVLGLHPRDIHLFTADAGMGQRAMIAPRGPAILFRTEMAKAVIYADRAVLFPARRLQDTVRVAQAIKSALAQRGQMPFELKVLEALLSETASAFDRKTKRLGMVADTILEDINRNFHASAAELQRSLPIARKLTEVQHDVKETLDAVADVANFDDQLQALCLTERARALAAGPAGSQAAKETWQWHVSGGAGGGANGQPAGESSGGGGAGGGPTLVQKKPKFGSGSSAGASSAGSGTVGNPGLEAGGGSLEGDSLGDPFAAPPQQHTQQTTRMTLGHNPAPSRDQPSPPPPLPGTAAYPPWCPPTPTTPAGAAAAQRSVHMRMASRILETYEFRMMGTHSALSEMMENMEQTRTVWHMTLDHQRNRVLRVNLMISISSLAGLISTMPAAYFGMNLDSGLEDMPGMFWPMVQGSVAFGTFVGGMMYAYYKWGPKRRYAARLRDMRSLRDLLSFHMDDLDAIIDAVRAKGELSRAEFSSVVCGAVKGKPMSKEEIALLWRVFDTNRDAVLELSELMRLEELQEGLARAEEDVMAHHIT